MTAAGGPGRRRFGVELEFSILDDAFAPLLGSAREVWSRRGDLPIVQELGSFQIEVNPPPLALERGAFRQLHAILAHAVAAMEAACQTLGGRLLPIGLAPRVPAAMLTDARFFADTGRYRAAAAYARRHRQDARLQFVRRPSLTLPNGSAVALINELHVHVEAVGEEEIAAVFEAAQDVTPLLTALGANSGWFDGERLAYLDHQVALFAQAESRPPSPHGGERVGIYPHRFEDAVRYFRWIEQFPLWVDVDPGHARARHLAVEKGYCGWVRLRMETDPMASLRVELRVPPAQPTLCESVALAEFAVRLVAARARAGLPGLDHRRRRANLDRCARHGLAATIFWCDGGEPREMPVSAVIGRQLDAIGDGDYLALLVPRLRRRVTPAQRLAEDSDRWGADGALQAYRSHFQADDPYVGTAS